MLDSTKGKDQSPSYLKLGMFSFLCQRLQQIMLEQDSCLGSGYKYQTLSIEKHNQSIKYKSIYFFRLRPPLRSRSRVDLNEFFSEYGCIDPVDLHCLSVSTIMVYTSIHMAASIWSTPTATLVQASYRLLPSSSMACVILPHTPLLELDQGQVIGSTLECQSLVDSLSYRYCLLLIAFIVYLITIISLCPIEIDLDRPYILFNPSFANLKLI